MSPSRVPRIKRLHLYVLQNFLPLFCMTFFICLFIVLMQFLWRYIDDLVGKGIGLGVIAELMGYAALTMVPMALPLAVLLASLMTFGNLGERLELTAMKSAGISLFNVMKPLIWVMVLVAVGAFFFQNNVLPIAQSKMWTLLFSVRQKAPELEIPEGTFYDQIPGYNIFIASKNRDTGVLHDMMIYDMSKGFDNATVILADSGRLAFTADKTHLYLHMWEGESFENLKDAGGRGLKNVPYRRETFAEKQLFVAFDANFNRLDEQGMRSQYVGKNMAQLRASIDSMTARVDSIGATYVEQERRATRVGIPRVTYVSEGGGRPEAQLTGPVDTPLPRTGVPDLDSIGGRDPDILQSALTRLDRQRSEVMFRATVISEESRLIRRHEIELMKKFTLSLACVIFFFIGAPLGAIIRKGGLGVPIVISVLLFIVYYIIDNFGYKMAREGRIDVWEGMWLSSIILLPLGVVLTWKAVNDSAVFNADAYVAFWRRITGRRQGRQGAAKEVIINPLSVAEAQPLVDKLAAEADAWIAANPPGMSYAQYWLHGTPRTPLRALAALTEQTVERLADVPDREVAARLGDFPVLRSLWVYHPARTRWLAWAAIVFVPLGLPLYFIGSRELRNLRAEITQISNNCKILSSILTHDQDS